MKEKSKKIIAWIALFCIIASVFGTGIMVIFSGNGNNDDAKELTPEQINQLKELINNQSGSTNTGEIVDNKIQSGSFVELQNNNTISGTGTQE